MVTEGYGSGGIEFVFYLSVILKILNLDTLHILLQTAVCQKFAFFLSCFCILS